MNVTFENKRIAGLLTVVPAEVSYFEDEIANFSFSRESSVRLQKMLGLVSHRYLKRDGITGSDMALAGIRSLFDRGVLNREDIGALIYVTQTPDHFIPPTSNVLQGALGLSHDTLCLDINQGCAGFLVGLMQGFLLLDTGIPGVLLVNADTASKQTNNRDRNTFPLVGDAVSIAWLERTTDATKTWMTIKMDGSRWQVLHIPAGAYRCPSSADTSIVNDLGNGNCRSKEHIHMDGNAIFNFTVSEVPEMIEELLRSSGRSTADIDYFMFHQPNRFILERLRERLGVPCERMPVDVSCVFGNASSASIPMTICHSVGAGMLSNRYHLCLAGFGVGLTWASAILDVGPLMFCEIQEF